MKKLFFGALVACAAATFVGCGTEPLLDHQWWW